jgi:hypothetical protein
MVDIVLLLMVVASAISLLVVSPRDLQRKAILALREYEAMEPSQCTVSDNQLPGDANGATPGARLQQLAQPNRS